jgi:ribonuclease HI
LAKIYEDQILREEMRGRERIMKEQCMARMTRWKAKPKARVKRAPHPAAPGPIQADIVIHVATHMEGNPGYATWAATILTMDGLTEHSDWYVQVTQPLMELEAMIAVLTFTREHPGTVAIGTTAKWIAKHLTNGRAAIWRRNDWQGSSGAPIKNADSWAELLRLCDERKPAVTWLGHSSTPEMKHCNELAARTFGEGVRKAGGRS